MRNYKMIVAMDEKGGIGKNNDLPWKIKTDMQYFKTMTTSDGKLKNVVIMGRKTWDSIPERFRPLDNRCNIILSRNAAKDRHLTMGEGAYRAENIEDAFYIIERLIESGNILDTCQIFVIGGGEIYRLFLEKYPEECKKIYITKVHNDFECDTFFPKLDDYQEILAEPSMCEGEHEFEFTIHERKKDEARKKTGLS